MTGRLGFLGVVLALVMASVGAHAQVSQQALTAAEVGQIISRSVQEAQARNVAATISVVDRVGNVLAVFQMTGATGKLRVTSGKGIVRTNGLEEVQDTFTNLGANGSPTTRLGAIAKAITGAYLSSSGNAFTTRTASQIIQEHFNPGESFSPSGPLFGVQFSQLPCSDLSVRQATNGVPTGLVDPTAGPKRSPLGLSADPGGLPLYKAGVVVGGVGIEINGVYTIDPTVADQDSSVEEIVALAGQFGFQPPDDIRANRIFVEGKSLRYIDQDVNVLASSPASAPAFVNGTGGNLVAVNGYYAGGGPLAGTAYGNPESGFATDPNGDYSGVGGVVFVLFNGANPPVARFRPRDSINPTVAGGGLTTAEVRQIIRSALTVAFASRAQIRRPLSSQVQVTVSVVDGVGNILGMARTFDGPLFGTDVSLQKARTATLFSNTNAGTYLGTFSSTVGGTPAAQNANGVTIADYVTAVRRVLGSNALQDGVAFADRSGGNLSRPYLPDGIIGAGNGPFSYPIATWSPFNTGLQLDVVLDNIAAHVLFADVGGANNDTGANCTGFTATAGTLISRISNGFQIFPGSVPIYRNGVVIGGIGVSGDGIDQDDMVSFLGLHNAGLVLGTGLGNAPPARRADQLSAPGGFLRYVNCPFKPFLGSRQNNVCHGK
ncbi:MAG: heme-binding protein [Proteobacteria bacterium]|nr:heme-binding protein [Pseudomonadota bacterium]MDA1059561.1 heme-binding protein [Pseudomonadota bacterium]